MSNTTPTPPAEPTPGTLRAQLAAAAPELYSALERSWKIALEEWIPAVPPSMDSFNSYPHLRNIETHLDQVITSAESLPSSPALLKLRPVELYILLASVLFHDLGRSMKGAPHPISGAEKISRDYGPLGIPSAELAKCIANITRAHEPPPDWLPSLLYDVVIDPYGEIRQRLLSALLVLGDHMDGSHNRARPLYIQAVSHLATIGLFRRCVRGVFADCQSQMVRVVLAEMIPWSASPDPSADPPHIAYTSRYEFPDPNDAKEKEALSRLGIAGKALKQIQSHYNKHKKTKAKSSGNFTWLRKQFKTSPWSPLNTPATGGNASLREFLSPDASGSRELALCRCLPQPAKLTTHAKRCLKAFKLPKQFSRLSALDWMVAFGFLHVELDPRDKKAQKKDDFWPHPSLLAAIMHDVAANSDALSSIQRPLAAAHIPLRAWLIEHREHLYTQRGLETYEPILTRDLLTRVLKAMWELTVTVFDSAGFTYAELASQARETDVSLVRCAVRRLAIVSRCEHYRARTGSSPPAQSEPDVIWAGDFEWRWVRCPSPESYCAPCALVSNCPDRAARNPRSKPKNGLHYMQKLIEHLHSPAI